MNDKMRVDFVCHHEQDGSWSFAKAYDDCTSWDTVLTDFLNFLSGVYGYDIRDKVSFETLEEKTDRLSALFEDTHQ